MEVISWREFWDFDAFRDFRNDEVLHEANEGFTHDQWFLKQYGYLSAASKTQNDETVDCNWVVFGVRCGVAQDGVIPEDGLVAFYPFHGNAEDESDFDNHAEVNGATLVNDRFGASEEAYLFAEYTDIVIPHADQIDMATGDTFSWAIWVLSEH